MSHEESLRPVPVLLSWCFKSVKAIQCVLVVNEDYANKSKK